MRYGTVLLCLLCGCAGLPPNTGRLLTYAVRNTDDTLLGQAVSVRTAQNPGKDGIFPLTSGLDAFTLRMALATAAQRSLDIQYYIWRPDMTGLLMFEEIWKAAERGVRVRLLLDDQGTRGLDRILAALEAHPNIEVRLFNPYLTRSLRVIDAAGDFSRINRRMHNKSFTADNQVAIVGGRNIADEYHGADPRVDFSDLDVAVAGPVVRQVSAEFDLYWNSESAYPVSEIIGAAEADDNSSMLEGWEKVHQKPEAQRYIAAVRSTLLLKQLLDRSLPLEWTSARIIYDDPLKVLRPSDQIETHLLEIMQAALGQPLRELDLVSPYFVPGEKGTEALTALSARGVKVRVLTNALAATDAGPVHAGYRKYRVDLLKGGVMLYELKPGVAPATRRQKDGDGSQKGVGGSAGTSLGVSLHAKTFSVDRQRLFVGSFNLDPRSARLNTEMGVVIDSPVLAGQLSEMLDSRNRTEAYRVQLGSDGDTLEWVESTPDGDRVFTREPETGLLRRIWINFLSILPIESLL
jgi:putative cardiolipin synthase